MLGSGLEARSHQPHAFHDRLLTLTALLGRDEAATLKVIQRVNVLQLRVSVNDAAGAINLPLLKGLNKESVHVLGLLVGEHRRQVLYIFKKSCVNIIGFG